MTQPTAILDPASTDPRDLAVALLKSETDIAGLCHTLSRRWRQAIERHRNHLIKWQRGEQPSILEFAQMRADLAGDLLEADQSERECARLESEWERLRLNVRTNEG